MKNDLKDAPTLGLYLAALWLSVAALPFALYEVGISVYASAVVDTFKCIRHRHD